MKTHSHRDMGNPPAPTCENCMHTIKQNERRDMVVCVPHLKTMPASNALVCDLHTLRHQRT
jgi:hypothetical protein